MIKYAITDGNWSSTSTWNDNTIPVDGDKVYCNGHVITLDDSMMVNNAITLFSENSDSEIRNDANDDYNIVQGGYVYYAKQSSGKTLYLNADLICDSTCLIKIEHFGNYTIYVYVSSIVCKSGICIENTASSSSTRQITLYVSSIYIENGKAATAHSCTLYNCKSIINHSSESTFSTNGAIALTLSCKDINILIDNGGYVNDLGSVTLQDVTSGNIINSIELSNSSHLSRDSGNNPYIIKTLTISDSSTMFTGIASALYVIDDLILLNINNLLYPSYGYQAVLALNSSSVSNVTTIKNITGSGTGVLLMNVTDVNITGNINLDGNIIICRNQKGITSITSPSITYNGIFPFDILAINDVSTDGINITYTGSNPPDFFIVGKGNMNDDTNYPAEADVKKGVSYACGAKTGTMESGGGVSPDTDNMIRRILGYVVRIYNRKFRNN